MHDLPSIDYGDTAPILAPALDEHRAEFDKLIANVMPTEAKRAFMEALPAGGPITISGVLDAMATIRATERRDDIMRIYMSESTLSEVAANARPSLHPAALFGTPVHIDNSLEHGELEGDRRDGERVPLN